MVRAQKKVQERRCVVTRESGPRDGLLRFVADPEGRVIPDIAERLPGRGVWVTATKGHVTEAARKKAFSRGLKTKAESPDNLVEQIEDLLLKRVLGMFAMANKAGSVIVGAEKVKKALVERNVAALFHASDAAIDGRSKIDRLAIASNDVPPLVIESYSANELSLALGRENVVHGALIESPVVSSLLTAHRRLAIFRGYPDDKGFDSTVDQPSIAAGKEVPVNPEMS